MPAVRRQRRRRRPVRGKRNQKGGIFPLLALIPAAIAAGKAGAMGAVSAGAGYAVKKALAGKKKTPKGRAIPLTTLMRRASRRVRR